MFHREVLDISFKHRYTIKTVFGDILGMEGIEHFSLDLVNPDKEMLFMSSTPQHAYEICKRGLGKYDGIISSDYYENLEFYWWDDAIHKGYASKIKEIREGLLNLRYGFMLVRQWNNFYLIYSFATKKPDLCFQSTVINNINQFLKMGDYVYSRMRDTYAIYSASHIPPTIEKFYKFEGGKPPARYTKDFIIDFKKENEIIQTANTQPNNIIMFKERNNFTLINSMR